MPCPRSLITLTVLLLGACGSNSTTEPGDITLAGLAGSWQIVHWEYSRASDPSDKVDWVALTDLSGSLAITSSGAFTVTPRLPGGFGQDFGQLTLQGDSVYWDGEDDEEWVHLTLAGRTLTLLWPEDELVDMDLDGEPEDTRLRVVLDGN
jgi:hypothetical protein